MPKESVCDNLAVLLTKVIKDQFAYAMAER